MRTERLDPSGHLALARALLQAGEQAEAREILRRVVAGSWEGRFAETVQQAERLLGSIEQNRNGAGR